LAAAVGGALAMLGLLLSLSRGSWIGFVFGVVVLLVKLPEARRALLALSIPLVAVALLVGAFAPTSPQVEVVGQRLQSISGERNPYDDRPAIWREARRQIETDPLTGHGPGSFPVASARATSASRTTTAEHAHNLALTWGAEAGLPAVAIAVGFAAHIHWRTRRLVRRADLRSERAVVAGVVAALTGVLGQGIVDYTLHNSVILVVLFALIGAALAFDRAKPSYPNPRPQSPSQPA
jgi:O-antigen ligase